MEISIVDLSNNHTLLKDRVLWYDGDSTVSADKITSTLTRDGNASGLFVDKLSEDIKQYNRFVLPDQQISIKKECGDIELSWLIPDEFVTIDVQEYVTQLFMDEVSDGYTDQQIQIRIKRILDEFVLYKELKLFAVLRTLIYIINTLNEHQVVWGVGRGSAVASYVLYLMGVHDVDSVEYELNITDFLRIE